MSIISPALILITIIYYLPFLGGTFLPPPWGQDGASIHSMLPHWTQEMDIWPSLDQCLVWLVSMGSKLKCCWYPTHTALSLLWVHLQQCWAVPGILTAPHLWHPCLSCFYLRLFSRLVKFPCSLICVPLYPFPNTLPASKALSQGLTY